MERNEVLVSDNVRWYMDDHKYRYWRPSVRALCEVWSERMQDFLPSNLHPCREILGTKFKWKKWSGRKKCVEYTLENQFILWADNSICADLFGSYFKRFNNKDNYYKLECGEFTHDDFLIRTRQWSMCN